MLRILFVALFCFLYQSSQAQQYAFVSYSTSAGLPQSQVTVMAQDADNYLWIGTLGGVARFNGKDFLTFSTNDGLFNNNITSISVQDNQIYVGHEGGISLIKNKKVVQTWLLPQTHQSIAVSCIFSFGNKVLVGTNGAGLFKIEDSLSFAKIKKEREKAKKEEFDTNQLKGATKHLLRYSKFYEESFLMMTK